MIDSPLSQDDSETQNHPAPPAVEQLVRVSGVDAETRPEELASLQRKIQEAEHNLHLMRRREMFLLSGQLHGVDGRPLVDGVILPGPRDIPPFPQPPLSLSQVDDFNVLIEKRNPDSEFRTLNPVLARHVEHELVQYVEGIFLKRRQFYLASTQLSGEAFALKAGFSSQKEMHEKIVIDIASGMFQAYLQGTGEETIELLDADIIEGLIDQRASFVAVTPSQQHSPAGKEKTLYEVQIRTIYRISRDILCEQVRGTYGQDESIKDTRAQLEQYALGKTGMTHSQLIEHLTFRVVNGLWQEYPTGRSLIQIARIRHDCRDVLTQLECVHLQELRGQPLTKRSSPGTNEVLLKEFKEAFKNCQRENIIVEFGARGIAVHAPLSVGDQEFISDVTVRMAGFDAYGNRRSKDEDFEIYSRVEEQLVRWKQPLQGELRGYLTEKERDAIRRFNQEGGHAKLTSREQFDFIQRHGLVLFIEKKIRKDMQVVLGTITAMSRTPCSPKGEENPEKWEQNPETLDIFPQYDFHDLLFPPAFSEQTRQELYNSAAHRLLICRSSILPSLSAGIPMEAKEKFSSADVQDRPLRRLGLAARLKYEVFRIAEYFGSDSLTFNIGQIHQPGSDIKMVNEPSSKHNSWADVLTWRTYFTSLKGDEVRMAWTAYQGKVKDGIHEFIREHGHLAGKGWEQKQMDYSVMLNLQRLEGLIDSGEHAAWLEKTEI